MQVNKSHIKINTIIEEEIIIIAAKSDMKEFSALYNRYYEQIFRFIYQRMDSEEAAADVCSQTFLNAMQKIDNYENRGYPFSSWLYIIARNEVNQYYRAQKKARVINAKTDDVFELMADFDEPTSDSRIDNLLLALSCLNDLELELIEMRYFEHRSYSEIMQIVDIPVNNLKVRVSRILKKLRKQFV